MGAQISGYLGKFYKSLTGKQMKTIIGLEPAFPCFFNNGKGLQTLNSSHAENVITVHSNCQGCGQEYPYGKASIYINGDLFNQPGCGLDMVCSHNRVAHVWCEAVFPENEYWLKARKCESFSMLKRNRCPGSIIYVGPYIDKNASGIYLLPTRSAQPFGYAATKSVFNANAVTCNICKKPRKPTPHIYNPFLDMMNIFS